MRLPESLSKGIDLEKKFLLNYLAALKDKPWGFGASTKGNVLLQYCGIGPDKLTAIYDVNPSKEGCVTPGTGIPITATRPEGVSFLVLPWHFKQDILDRHPQDNFIFPLPQVEIVNGK